MWIIHSTFIILFTLLWSTVGANPIVEGSTNSLGLLVVGIFIINWPINCTMYILLVRSFLHGSDDRFFSNRPRVFTELALLVGTIATSIGAIIDTGLLIVSDVEWMSTTELWFYYKIGLIGIFISFYLLTVRVQRLPRRMALDISFTVCAVNLLSWFFYFLLDTEIGFPLGTMFYCIIFPSVLISSHNWYSRRHQSLAGSRFQGGRSRTVSRHDLMMARFVTIFLLLLVLIFTVVSYETVPG